MILNLLSFFKTVFLPRASQSGLTLIPKAADLNRALFFWLGLFMLILNQEVAAQDTLDVDKAFLRARELAFSGKRTEARSLARRILRKSPGYADVQILIGRTYSWDKQYDSARVVLQPLLLQTPPPADALNALIDVELWSDNPRQAIVYADQALTLNPQATEIQIKKAQALTDLKDFTAARELTNNLLKNNPGNGDALRLANTIKLESSRQSISATFQQDWFSGDFDSWRAVALAYSHQTNKLGAVTGRFNYAHRFGNDALQLEADAYPKISKKMYAYVNAGYSGTSLFPKFRSGLSLYRSLPKSFEAELGVRYLRFDDNNFIYTGSISKYYGNFFFSFRPFITPGDIGISQSYFLLSRYYLGNATDFFTLTIGSGFSPDDNSKDVALINTATLQSRKVRLDFQKAVAPRTYISTLIGFDHQEYSPASFRNNITFNVGVQQLF